MIDLFKENHFILTYGIALILSVLRYRYYFDTVLKYLPIIITYTFLSEILGFMIYYEDFQIVFKEGYSYYNHLIFNIFDVIFFLYFYFVFWKVLRDKSRKKMVFYGSIAFLITSLINPFVQDPIIYPQIYMIAVGSLVLIVAVLLYLWELKLEPRKIPNNRNLLFWISIGFLIFYPLYPLIMLVGLLDYELYQKLSIRTIHHLLIELMYLCFIIGFVRMTGKRGF